MEKLAYYFAYPNGLSQVILRISVRQTFHGMLDETVTHHHPPPLSPVTIRGFFLSGASRFDFDGKFGGFLKLTHQ